MAALENLAIIFAITAPKIPNVGTNTNKEKMLINAYPVLLI